MFILPYNESHLCESFQIWIITEGIFKKEYVHEENDTFNPLFI